MLHHLIAYAERQGLAAEPGFSPKSVRWAVEFDRAGRFLEVHPLGEDNSGRQFPRCPDLTQQELIRGGKVRCHFLVETAQVVALHAKEDEEPAKVATAQQKHAFFVQMLRDASEALPSLAPAADALSEPQQLARIRERLKAQKAKPTDKVTLYEGGVFPLESEAWHDWWRGFRRGLGASSDKAPDAGLCESPQLGMVCFLTGELAEPEKTQEKIVGLGRVGGRGNDSLVSFDKGAFASYGLEQGANAAMSKLAAKAYREALNSLIRDYQTRVPGALLLHWFKERITEPDDPLAWLAEPPAQEERSAQQAARALLTAIETGRRPDLSDNHYYALTLSGAAGRVMLRAWMEGPFADLVASVSEWFEDLEIVHREGDRLAKAPKFLAVLGGLGRDLDEVPVREAATLMQSALGGRVRSIPTTAIARATLHARADFATGETPNHARMGLIKAFHIRKQKGGVPMSPYLNEDHPDPAYHCGRLLAVLAGLQRSALGDVGAGVVQRYYTATSQAPALTVGRLVANAKNHLNKLNSPGLAWWYEEQIAGVMGRIGDRLPRTLDLERQSLFALGYYQQLAHNRSGKANEETAKEEASNA